MIERRQKITFAEMRSAGVHALLVCRTGYRCRHSVTVNGDRWLESVRPALCRMPLIMTSI
jgi:hypothetical protein